jgi:hypothetical protein
MQKCAACLSEDRDVAKTCSVLATRHAKVTDLIPEAHPAAMRLEEWLQRTDSRPSFHFEPKTRRRAIALQPM